MAGGADTEAAALIEMAGGINAAPEISGYKPLSDEAVIAAQPDVILTMSRGNHQISPEQVFGLPALQTTPAAAEQALVSMNGLLLLGRSEEHTSELQSLMRTQYDVFCLKKTNR